MGSQGRGTMKITRQDAVIDDQSINSAAESAWLTHHGESQLEIEVKYSYSAATGYSVTIVTGDTAGTEYQRGGEEDAGSGTRNLYPLTWTRTVAADDNFVWPVRLTAQRFKISIVGTGSPDANDKATVNILGAQV